MLSRGSHLLIALGPQKQLFTPHSILHCYEASTAGRAAVVAEAATGRAAAGATTAAFLAVVAAGDAAVIAAEVAEVATATCLAVAGEAALAAAGRIALATAGTAALVAGRAAFDAAGVAIAAFLDDAFAVAVPIGSATAAATDRAAVTSASAATAACLATCAAVAGVAVTGGGRAMAGERSLLLPARPPFCASPLSPPHVGLALAALCKGTLGGFVEKSTRLLPPRVSKISPALM
jgi:hypothetical protein